MKKQITILLGLSLFLGFAFAACEENEKVTPTEERVLYPKTIKEYYEGVLSDTQIFEYNSNKQLISRDYGYGYYETYEYDESGKLIRINEYEDESLYKVDSLVYNENSQVVKLQSYNAGGDVRGWVIYEYNTAGFVSKRLEYLADETHYSNQVYTYDENGNITNKKTYKRVYETGEIPTDVFDEENFEYDNKNNVFKSIGLPFRYETHINNVTKETFTQTPDRDDNYSNTYTYKYNNDNYPIESVDNYDEKLVVEYIEL